MIFQDPYASLDPRMSVGAAISGAAGDFHVEQPQQRQRVAMLLKRVHLAPITLAAIRRQFSADSARICIAPALTLEPGSYMAAKRISASTYRSGVRCSTSSSLCRRRSASPISHHTDRHDRAHEPPMRMMRGGELRSNRTQRQVLEECGRDLRKALIRLFPVPIPRRATSDLRPALQHQ